MKVFRSLALLSTLLFSSQAHAVVVSTPKSLEALVRDSGSNSIWVSDAEVQNVEYSTNAVGMEVVTLTLNGVVLKTPSQGYMHPVFGTWVKASEEPQTFKVMMLNSQKYSELRNLISIPSLGSHISACFTAPNPKANTGVSSPCGGQENGLFMESMKQGETVLSNSSANKALGIKGISTPTNSSTSGVSSFSKALQSVKSQSDDSVSKENFKEILKGLIQQYHPVKAVEVKPAPATRVEAPPAENGNGETENTPKPEEAPEEIQNNDSNPNGSAVEGESL